MLTGRIVEQSRRSKIGSIHYHRALFLHVLQAGLAKRGDGATLDPDCLSGSPNQFQCPGAEKEGMQANSVQEALIQAFGMSHETEPPHMYVLRC